MDIKVENKSHGTVFYLPFSVEALNRVAEELYEEALKACQEQQTQILKEN